jgi:hypothetical protein
VLSYTTDSRGHDLNVAKRSSARVSPLTPGMLKQWTIAICRRTLLDEESEGRVWWGEMSWPASRGLKTVRAGDDLREQVYPSIVVSVKKRSGRRYLGVVQLHGYLDLDRYCGSHFVAASVLINSLRFFPWRRTFGQRAALSVDRPNAAHSAYQQQLHRWDRGLRKPASASVHASSLQQSATPLPTRMFNCEHFWYWQYLLESPCLSELSEGYLSRVVQHLGGIY